MRRSTRLQHHCLAVGALPEAGEGIRRLFQRKRRARLRQGTNGQAVVLQPGLGAG